MSQDPEHHLLDSGVVYFILKYPELWGSYRNNNLIVRRLRDSEGVSLPSGLIYQLILNDIGSHNFNHDEFFLNLLYLLSSDVEITTDEYNIQPITLTDELKQSFIAELHNRVNTRYEWQGHIGFKEDICFNLVTKHLKQNPLPIYKDLYNLLSQYQILKNLYHNGHYNTYIKEHLNPYRLDKQGQPTGIIDVTRFSRVKTNREQIQYRLDEVCTRLTYNYQTRLQMIKRINWQSRIKVKARQYRYIIKQGLSLN